MHSQRQSALRLPRGSANEEQIVHRQAQGLEVSGTSESRCKRSKQGSRKTLEREAKLSVLQSQQMTPS
jgi:hypothetical protein